MATIKVNEVEAKILMAGLEKMMFKLRNDDDRLAIIRGMKKSIEIVGTSPIPDGIIEKEHNEDDLD